MIVSLKEMYGFITYSRLFCLLLCVIASQLIKSSPFTSCVLYIWIAFVNWIVYCIGSCLVIVIISICFVFLIENLCLQVFWSLEIKSKVKNKHHFNSRHYSFLLSLRFKGRSTNIAGRQGYPKPIYSAWGLWARHLLVGLFCFSDF